MDKLIEQGSLNNILTISDRKGIVLNGIKKIDTFDKNEFFVDTNLGYLHICGEELEIIKLDTLGGNLSIKGKINSVSYIDNNSKKGESNILLKLFKW